MVAAFRALGHPARLRILRTLAERGTCICGEIVDELPLAQSTVSQHLKVLKEAGLIAGEIEGSAVCYFLVPGAMESAHRAMGELVSRVCGPGSQCPV